MSHPLTQKQIAAFRHASNIVYLNRPSGASIGTLAERMLHAILKQYLCEDQTYHEIRVGRYHADICVEGHIWEIQTRRLDRLLPKLDQFLEAYEVTVVYPIAYSKTVAWIDPENGTMTKGRKSPKRGSIYSALYELFYIREYLTHPRFSFQAILCDMEEFRTLTGYGPKKKKRAPRVERIPTALVDEVLFEGVMDYTIFLPDTLPNPFTVKEYAKATRLSESAARRGLQVLSDLGLIEDAGKRGRAKLYGKCEVAGDVS